MTIYGIFNKYKWKDEKTGDALFTVCMDDGTYTTCKGISIPLSYGIPLQLEGSYVKINESIIFNTKKILLNGYNDAAMRGYLHTQEFRMVGDTTARKLMLETGTDIFAFMRKYRTIDDAMNSIKYNTDVVRSILSRILEKVEKEEVLNYVLGLGGYYCNAIKLYRKMKNNTVSSIKKNPYLLLYSDVPAKVVEKTAKEAGVKVHDHKRLTAIVDNAIDVSRKQGNTKLTFHELVTIINETEKDAGYYTHPLFIAEELTNPKYRVVEEDGETYVYEEKDYITEKSIAENIYRLSTSSEGLPMNPLYIEETESELGIKYSEEQKEAFNVLKSSGIKIITGGPGTGKTTFLNGCIKMYRKNNANIKIVLCAPTGCAAARMHDSTGETATTIHKLLGIGIEPVAKKGDRIDADVVILDEVSMVGIELFQKLLSSIRNGGSLLLIGDKNQLPSIDPGNILSDLIHSGMIETHQFKQIFRQSKGNSIIENANLVIQGNTKLVTDENFTIRRYKKEKDLLNSISVLCKKAALNYTVFTSARKTKFESGSIMLNRRICEALRDKGDGINYGNYTFHVGDRIIFNRNNYEKNYYNGEVGTITSIQKFTESIKISIMADDGTIYLEDSDLNDIELGYVLTAHKAQGSECDNAVIVVAKNPSNMLQRKLLYVEITRAKKAVFIMSEEDALEECITNNRTPERKSGLTNQLNRVFA